MDQDDQYLQERQSLLSRFRESLKLPMSERYFDEDDLIEIFDYAGDLNDDYLRMEALMCAARYFPDSEELNVRRGIFYSQYSNDTLKKFVEDTPSNGNFIIELLKVRNSVDCSKEELINNLDNLVDSQIRLTDEEVIQLLDTASSLNLYKVWLKPNYDKIREKAEYKNVFIYEAAAISDLNQDYQTSAKMFEELTEIEPFNSYYWVQLAKEYNLINDTDKALSAVDYALAIKPNFTEALLLKAKIKYDLDCPLEEIADTLLLTIKNSEEDIPTLKFLSSIYAEHGDLAKASAMLKQALKYSTPAEQCEIIPELMLYLPEDTPALLDRYFQLNEDNSQLMWQSWAQNLGNQGYTAQALAVIECYERNAGLHIPSLFALENAFISKKFNEALEIIKEIEAIEFEIPSVFAIHIVSLLKVGEYLQTLALCDYFLKNFNIDKYHSLNNRLDYIGLTSLIDHVVHRLSNNNDPSDWEDFDPFHYWQADE